MNAVVEQSPLNAPALRLSAVEIRAQVNLVQEVMRAVMEEGTHFGKIPGTDKPTLYKAGGEKLALTFRLAPGYEVLDLSTPDHVAYRVTCRLTHQTSGVVMGDGIGSCSSSEEKYRWRRPVCDEEFAEAPDDRKRMKWARGRGNPYQQKQIRTEPADLDNTVLKMAAKRAFLAAVLNATAASDIFTQDIEDLPEELRDVEETKREPIKDPQSKGAPPAAEHELTAAAQISDEAPLTEGARKTLAGAMARAARTEADLVAAGLPALADLRFGKFNAVMSWLRANPAN